MTELRETVLIITDALDIHADTVIRELHRREVPVFRFHPDEFPTDVLLTLGGEHTGDGAGPPIPNITTAHRRLDVHSVRSAWLRRPGAIGAKLAPSARDALRRTDSHLLLTALYNTIPANRWVCRPEKRALFEEDRALQLRVAREVGLAIPKTLITNDPARARAFAASLGPGRCLIKQFQAVPINAGKDAVWMPMRLFDASLPDEALGQAPLCFQERVSRKTEIRVVGMGRKLFATRVHLPGDPESGPIDMRRYEDKSLRHETLELPATVQASIREMMRRFGIQFCSMDLLERDDGQLVFVDLNPAGQWLWLEGAGHPLVSSMADLLLSAPFAAA